MNKQKSSKFRLGVLIGAVTGALAGLFLAPKKGRELRKDARDTYERLNALFDEKKPDEAVAEIYGKVSEKTVAHLKKTRRSLARRLADFRVGVSRIDKRKYVGAVRDVIDEAGREQAFPEQTLAKLRKYLEADYKKLTSKKVKKTQSKKKKK